MTVSDIKVSLDAVGRCDDRSDENITNPFVVDKAILKRVGELETIDKVRLSKKKVSRWGTRSCEHGS